jgi:hypothetical protein
VSDLEDGIRKALRPLVHEVVADELDRRLVAHDRPTESSPYLTVAQYAEVHQTTSAAVRSRIRRGALTAIRPPGAREYLIPNDLDAGDHHD